MTAFDVTKQVEARAYTILLPFIEDRSDGLVLTNKGALAKWLQATTGDAMFTKEGQLYTLEIKAERKHTGNLFLETWSNKNLAKRESHAERGSNPGWLVKLRSDLLFYYFLNTDQLYIINLFKLQQWAFNPKTVKSGGLTLSNNLGKKPRIDDFPEIPQSKYNQPNDTWGRLVGIDIIRKEVGLKELRVAQLSLDGMAV